MKNKNRRNAIFFTKNTGQIKMFVYYMFTNINGGV